MRIGFDARCFEEENISGVGEYAFELLKGILGLESDSEVFVFSNSFGRIGSKHIERLGEYSEVKLKNFSFPNKILNFIFWYLDWPKIDKMINGVDVFFAPNINFISISDNCSLVATFHDLSFERYPHFFTLKSRIWHKYFVNPKKIARRAVKIIAVSESTKRDIEQIYKIKPNRIEVIHHGISEDFRVIDPNDLKMKKIKEKYKLPEKFILYLGNIEPRKNIRSIIAAFQEFTQKRKENSGYILVLVGTISPLLFRNIDFGENVIHCDYIKREDRPYIYNLTSLFVYPSFFEGFGLPLLEAMACGIPTISSHNSSIPEVAEKSTVLVDPNRPAEISQAMNFLLSDEKLYARIRSEGLRQAQKFNWKKCAKRTLEIIQNAKIVNC